MSKLKIEFSVQEPESQRYVTFSGEVNFAELREWFAKSCMGVEHLFGVGNVPALVKLTAIPYNQKIQTIKLVREWTGCGLKEAKDLVEGAFPGVPSLYLVSCDSTNAAAQLVAQLGNIGVSASVAAVSSISPGAQAILPKYVAPARFSTSSP